MLRRCVLSNIALSAPFQALSSLGGRATITEWDNCQWDVDL